MLDDFLCLHMFTSLCVVALDFSSAQNFILELKIAAIIHLDYQEYLQILGEVKCDSYLR